MDRLVALLNEYEKDWLNEFETYVERWYCERTKQILSGKWENNNELKPCEIISKKYWIIKWLLDNDKININEEWDDYEETNLSCNSDFFQLQKHYSYYESLIMLLAIQENPISFLISILK